VVVAVPNSSIPAAKGYAAKLGIPFQEGIILQQKGRTFIQPGQEKREEAVRNKFEFDTEVLSGRRVAVVDDTLVRGTTLREIFKRVMAAGASEVYGRIPSAPIRHIDPY